MSLNVWVDEADSKMFADVEELKKSIIEHQPDDFVSHYLFAPIPHIFQNNHRDLVRWKGVLSTGIEVDPKDIVILGSASIGFSLNPAKNFREYGDESDVDCGIISQHYFDLAWRHLRKIRAAWLSLTSLERTAVEKHRKNYVFAGAIATERILGILPFGKAWQPVLRQMGTIDPTKTKEVKIRIYKDYDALRSYHVNNIRNIRDDLLGAADEQSVIKTED
jgi:hypothetical protein